MTEKLVYYKKGLPRKYSLVIATVTRVISQGAYAFLDEYGLEAFLPLDEIASTRIESILDFVKIGRKYVCKVIRVNPYKRHIDVSLKRVSDSERRDKIIEWKRWQKALKLLELSALESGTSFEYMKSELIPMLEKKFGGDLFAVFEEARRKGVDYLLGLGVPDGLAEKIYEKALEHVKVEEVEVRGVLKVRSFAPNGVKLIRESLLEGLKAARRYRNVRVELKTMGAPRYRLVLRSDNYKSIERALKAFLEKSEARFKELHLSLDPPYRSMHVFSFKREHR